MFACGSIPLPCPGFFEELLFRGVIQQWLGAHVGDLPSLGLTSVLFGLAHSPVPGASSFTEACYGANFGLLYMARNQNIAIINGRNIYIYVYTKKLFVVYICDNVSN